MEQVKEKIIKLSKGLYVATKVLYIISISLFFVFAIEAIVFPLTGIIKGYSAGEIAIAFSVLALYSFIGVGLLWNISQLFRTIYTEKTPFSLQVNKYLKKSAGYILAISIIPALIGSILKFSICPNSEFSYHIEVTGILAGLVLYFIGLFFTYGNELKNRDDETLW